MSLESITLDYVLQTNLFILDKTTQYFHATLE